MDRDLPLTDRVQVRPGDTAQMIALRAGGAAWRWPELKAVNPPRDWDRLSVGEVLRVPPLWTRAAGAPAAIGALSLADARARTPWLDDAFFPRLVAIANKYGIPADQLLGVLYQESGVHPFANPNRVTHANGLIHWMPGTAPLGTTDAQLVAMTATEQLALVDAWLAPWARAMRGAPFNTAGLVYATVFAPGRLGPNANESTLIFAKTTECEGAALRTNPYCANIGLDLDRKGSILMSDLTRTIQKRMREASFAKFAVRLAAEGGNAIDPSPSPPSGPPSLPGPVGPVVARARTSWGSFVLATLGVAAVGGVGVALVRQAWGR